METEHLDAATARARLSMLARVEERLVRGDEAEPARELLRTARIGHLALPTGDWPYIVPIAFAYDGAAAYFHGGEGLTGELLALDPRVCLQVTSAVDLLRARKACDYTFQYESVLAFGTATTIIDESERERCLRLIVAKYDAANAAVTFDQEKFADAHVYRLEIEALTYRRAPED
jgi:uncharacterized protein